MDSSILPLPQNSDLWGKTYCTKTLWKSLLTPSTTPVSNMPAVFSIKMFFYFGFPEPNKYLELTRRNHSNTNETYLIDNLSARGVSTGHHRGVKWLQQAIYHSRSPLFSVPFCLSLLYAVIRTHTSARRKKKTRLIFSVSKIVHRPNLQIIYCRVSAECLPQKCH